MPRAYPDYTGLNQRIARQRPSWLAADQLDFAPLGPTITRLANHLSPGQLWHSEVLSEGCFVVLSIPVIDCALANAEAAIELLREKLSPRGDIVSEAGRQRTISIFGEALPPKQVVARICADIRAEGRPALDRYTKLLDGVEHTDATLRVSAADLEFAHASAPPEFLKTIQAIEANIVEFQSAILNSNVSVTRERGGGRVSLRQRYLPLRRVGICVPGGAAAYPSTVLMTAVPARVAGVHEIAVIVPPTEFGGYNPLLLATCHALGIREVYRVGGAQAVAALAYGTCGIPRVDKIVGPGNLFVALAKQHVFGEVDIDSIAGPSEVVVLADESANAEFIASDLISQAEHSPGSGVLITWHRPLVEKVVAALEQQLGTLQRGDLALASLNDYGAIIIAPSAAEAIRLTDLMAPEHLHISTANPEVELPQIQNAGSIFLGHHTPVAVGDYFAGPSHVLPTGGTARFANGLCANDFLKRSSVIAFDKWSLADASADIEHLAAVEGLTAHTRSVSIRLEQ